MERNNLLKGAIFICKGMQTLLIFIFCILTLLFIHIQVDSTFYKDKIVNIDKSEINYNSSREIILKDNPILTLDQMTTSSLYITYIRYSAMLALFFLSVGEFKKIMKSVQSINTFRIDNVKSFRRIGQYAIIYFFVSSFYSYEFNEIGYTGFRVSFAPFILALFAFIMAEIFKEGNLLLEDKELTI